MTLLLPMCKALADETRLRLLNILIHHELNVNELVGLLGMGQSRVSRHLKILADSELVESRRDGLWVFYSAASEGEARPFIETLTPLLLREPFSAEDLAAARRVLDERTQETREFFNDIATQWDRMSRDLLDGFDLHGAIIDLLPCTDDCGVTTDLGCGTGTLIGRLRSKASSVIGVDGSQKMLDEARRRLDGLGMELSLRIGDLEHLPLRDGEADTAICNMVLHHLSHPAEGLQEIHRILARGGSLVLADFASHDREELRGSYGDRWLGFDTAALEKWLTDAGFTLHSTDTRPVGNGLSVITILARK